MPRAFLVFIIDFIYFILYIKMFNRAITNKTNILSYFIKDIKDHVELSFYKQNNHNTCIFIIYKGKILYKLQYYGLQIIVIWNYKTNISIEYYSDKKTNYKICSDKRYKQKTLYYKKDNKLDHKNTNFIYYSYIYTKYLQKIFCAYVIEYESLLSNKIKYYNGYKYIYNSNDTYGYFKYKHGHIFIMNKYELYYNNYFFNLYN